jgi:hypothetical protein
VDDGWPPPIPTLLYPVPPHTAVGPTPSVERPWPHELPGRSVTPAWATPSSPPTAMQKSRIVRLGFGTS